MLRFVHNSEIKSCSKYVWFSLRLMNIIQFCHHALSQNQHAWKLMFFLVMENVTGIHFSKCKCPGGYGGDPYNFSQESWDVCQCSFWSWRMWVKSIFQKVNVPAATVAIHTIFLQNYKMFVNVLSGHGECDWNPFFKM